MVVGQENRENAAFVILQMAARVEDHTLRPVWHTSHTAAAGPYRVS